jgi:hypothetical protein
MALTAFPPVNITTVTSKLPVPSLQRHQPHDQQQRQLAGTSAFSDALIEDLQSLLAIVRGLQSSRPRPRRPESFLRRSSVLPPPPEPSPSA